MEVAKAGQEGRRPCKEGGGGGGRRAQSFLSLHATAPPPLVQEEPQLQQEYEMDEWLMNFARAFSDITGIDPIA